MRAYYQGNTYLVEFTDSDTHCFAAHTDADPRVVHGRGAFLFDTRTGDLIDARGAAAEHGGRVEWLSFSQDAQDYGRGQLAREGLMVNPFDFRGYLPELAANPGKKKDSPVGRRVELVHTGDQWTRLRPGARGTVEFVDDSGTIFVAWDEGSRLGLVPGVDHFQYVDERAGNPARISRTRGVKTMRGPYSARRGYKPWIQRRGKLGTGFLTTMTKEERHKALDRCWKEYGYRSCLGSIMVLERAKTGRGGVGEGVGTKYAGKLRESREYLKKTYGGAGSFGPRKKKAAARLRAAEAGPGYMANPGKACVWRTAQTPYGATIPIMVWTGGAPTETEFEEAAPFTIFPGRGLRENGPIIDGEAVVIDGVEEMAWFASERDMPYDGDVEHVLGAVLGLQNAGLSTTIQINDDLRGKTVTLRRGGKVKLKDDMTAWPLAMESGFTLIKVPDAMTGKQSQYAEIFVLDDEGARGWKHTKLRKKILKAVESNPCGAAPTFRGANPGTSPFSEVSFGELDWEPDDDQFFLLDRIVLAAKMDGDAYRANDPKAAVERAFKEIKHSTKEQLEDDYKKVKKDAVRLVGNRWRDTNPREANPPAQAHLERAKQLAARIGRDLERVEMRVDDMNEEVDDEGRMGDDAIPQLEEAIVLLEGVQRMIPVLNAEVRYAGSAGASVPAFSYSDVETLLGQLRASLVACQNCAPPGETFYKGISAPRTRRKASKGTTRKKKKRKKAS